MFGEVTPSTSMANTFVPVAKKLHFQPLDLVATARICLLRKCRTLKVRVVRQEDQLQILHWAARSANSLDLLRSQD